MPSLYIREVTRKPSAKSRVVNDHIGFVKESTQPSYRAAVTRGQLLAGYGNFYVESTKPPTREEQLLLPPRRRASALDLAQLID